MEGLISDRAVREATGRGWNEWFELLRDAEGDEQLSHTRLAAHLHDRHSLSFWWSQTVAGEYEKKTGRRETGETLDGGFQIGAQKSMPFPAEEGWRRLLSPAGRRIWLGESDDFRLEEGAAYRTAENTRGEVRVWKPGDHLRLTWLPNEWSLPSTLQIRCRAKGENRCTISFHQEKLADGEVREAMRLRWKDVLRELARLEPGE